MCVGFVLLTLKVSQNNMCAQMYEAKKTHHNNSNNNIIKSVERKDDSDDAKSKKDKKQQTTYKRMRARLLCYMSTIVWMCA